MLLLCFLGKQFTFIIKDPLWGVEKHTCRSSRAYTSVHCCLAPSSIRYKSNLPSTSLACEDSHLRARLSSGIAPITTIAPRAHETHALPDELGNWKPITQGVRIMPVTVSCFVTKTAFLLRPNSVGPVWVQSWMRDAFSKILIISLGHPLGSKKHDSLESFDLGIYLWSDYRRITRP